MKDEYVPFGKEWEAEMMKWNKKQLIEYIKRLAIKVKELAVLDRRLK